MEEDDDEVAVEEFGDGGEGGAGAIVEFGADSGGEPGCGSNGRGGSGGRSSSGAPGGPLAVPGFVSGRISVRDFRDSCGALLSAVKAELDDFSIQGDDLDISVDDLKIMTDAVLVEKALTEVLKGQDALLRLTDGNTGPQSHGEQSNGTPEHHLQIVPVVDAQSEELEECQQEPQAASTGNGQLQFNFSVPPKTGKKRGRPFDRDKRAALLMDDTDARREEALARLKKERDNARENVSLHSLRAKKERESLYTKDQRPLRTLKFLNSILKARKASQTHTPKLASKEQFEPMKDGEVLLTVEIYDNIKRTLKTQELIVCGSQPLTALKDRIYCLTDTVAEKAKLKAPSSYFLIEECFYNDMRDSRALDYSLPIRNWVREKAEAIEKWKGLGGASENRKRRWFGSSSGQKSTLPPSFLAAKMENVSFMDIECRLGAQFLYCHQGDCKHTIVIRDMRLVHSEDVQNAAAYPVLRYVHKLRHRKCTICCIYQATKVTFGDKLAPDSPCFFCDHCYYLLHYSSDGVLLYDDFQVHDYFHE